MSRKITARFYVASIEYGPGTNATGKVVLQPAYASGANADWAAATPSGRIELFVNAEGAMGGFDEWRLGRDDIHVTLERVADLPD
jgi:hypothetical protein